MRFCIVKKIRKKVGLSSPAFCRTKSGAGFTLLEVIVSVAIFSFVVVIAYSMYSLGQNVYRRSGSELELWQNARASLDRLTREIRQAEDLATILPEEAANPLDPPKGELQFQDGHNTSSITYIRYYLNGTDLKRQIIAYYFSSEPSFYVRWDSENEFGQPPEDKILEEKIVGEYFTDLNFWGAGGLINMSAALEKGGRGIELMTAVYGRNL